MSQAEFGTRIRRRRKELGMSQQTVARKAGIGTSTISDMEVGGRLPRVDTAVMVAKALRTTVEELMGVSFSGGTA